ncbi:MAG: hypothetical protein JOZ92_07380 [Candidatus Dormibacteraeota bacterium]|nr:hypothetical protein [Candidatus Dormibacteraeota bacterium]
MRRFVTVLVLLALMGAFAFGVNRFLASRRTVISATVQAPTKSKPKFALPGVMIVAQDGQLYRLQDGEFTSLDLPTDGQWMQPAAVPGQHAVVAVERFAAYSEVFLVSDSGTLLGQLSHNKTGSSTIQYNHWMFWPRVAQDGHTVLVSYDAPKSIDSYEIDFAIWKGDLSGSLVQEQLSDPNGYTGGDTQAQPLPDGSFIYAKYTINNEALLSQIALQKGAHDDPALLTSTDDDCGQPALSPDGTQLAMICIGGTSGQSSRLEVASFNGTALGTPRVLVQDCLCSSPAWAPDGSGLVYYNTADATGHFEMWWLAGAATAAPKPTKLVTTSDDFDATSAPAWTAS